MNRIATLLSLVGAIVLFSYHSAKANHSLTLVMDESYAPYTMRAAEYPAGGIYADIVRRVDQQLPDYTIQIKALPWMRAEKEASSGTAAGVIGTYHRPQERLWISDFSTPLLKEQVFVYCRHGITPTSGLFPHGFKGLRFANNTDYHSAGHAFFVLVARGDIHLEETTSTQRNIRKMIAGRVDCYVQDDLQMQHTMAPGDAKAINRVAQVSSEHAYVGFSHAWKRSWKADFITQFNDVLQSLHDQGVVQDIIDAHLQKPLH